MPGRRRRARRIQDRTGGSGAKRRARRLGAGELINEERRNERCQKEIYIM